MLVIPGLVGVGVDSGVSNKTSGVGVGVGWPLHPANSAIERIKIAKCMGPAGVIIPNEVR